MPSQCCSSPRDSVREIPGRERPKRPEQGTERPSDLVQKRTESAVYKWSLHRVGGFTLVNWDPGEVEGRGSEPTVGEERDKAADQRDRAAGERDRAGDERDEAGDARDRAGDRRDQVGDARDHAAEERDHAAEERDQVGEASDAASGWTTTGAVSRSALARREAASDRRRASQDRRAGASERGRAELDRDTALADRGAGASDRGRAEVDRDTALADRGRSAREREDASVDELTGVYLRGAGLVQLDQEMARARRNNLPLILAFLDVDHLKTINDSRGHAAGDRLLLEVADTFRAELRSYDLIIRYGGDEFVCAISGLSKTLAAQRFAQVNAALADAPEHGSVTVGLAEMQPDDSLGDLVARADAALYQQRREERTPGV